MEDCKIAGSSTMTLPAPFYQRGPVTIYRADCLALLPIMATGSVDAVVTDPPYGTKVTAWDESIESLVFRECCRVSSGFVVMFYGNTRLYHILSEFKKCDRDCWTMVWHKSNSCGFERLFAPQWTPIVVAYMKGCEFWGQDYFNCPMRVQSETLDHPTPKQPGVVQWLCEKSAKPGCLVLDPFIGSGTTAVCCIRAGRRCIGIDRDKRSCEITAKRCDAELNQGRLFEPEPEISDGQKSIWP